MARLPPGSSISLTNSVELSPRPVNPEILHQRIDKVISENQAIVETWDSLHWPRRLVILFMNLKLVQQKYTHAAF